MSCAEAACHARRLNDRLRCRIRCSGRDQYGVGCRAGVSRSQRRSTRTRNPIMTTEGFLNTYHNASSPPAGDVPEDLVRFMAATDPALAPAADLSRVLARAHP